MLADPKDRVSEISTIHNLLVFDFLEPIELDNIYSFKYGNRQLSSKAESTDKNVVVRIIANYFAERWDNHFLTITETIEELKNYTETVKETITDSGSIEFNRNSLNKVSAFNADDFVDSSGDDNIETSETENEKIRTYEITKLKDMNFYDNVLNYLNKANVYDIMMADINSVITKLILN